MSGKNKKRFLVQLPPYHEKKLLLWAYCKGQSKTALMQNIVQARVEANDSQIEDMIRDRAEDWGCSAEDARDRILKEMGWEASEDSSE